MIQIDIPMPKTCYECPCHDGEYGRCQITGNSYYDEIPRSCPCREIPSTRQERTIDKNAIEEIPRFNVGDEVVSRSSGLKGVVVFQDGTSVSVWYPLYVKSCFGYVYLSPEKQIYDAFAVKKTGKSYPEFAKALKEMLGEN